MPNLDAPARLAFWPQRPWDEGSDYDTLRQALADAAQHPSETPWIVTQSGKILKPREVADLISMLRGDESDSGIRCFSWLKMRFERGPKPGSMPKPMSLKLRGKMAGWSSRTCRPSSKPKLVNQIRSPASKAQEELSNRQA